MTSAEQWVPEPIVEINADQQAEFLRAASSLMPDTAERAPTEFTVDRMKVALSEIQHWNEDTRSSIEVKTTRRLRDPVSRLIIIREKRYIVGTDGRYVRYIETTDVHSKTPAEDIDDSPDKDRRLQQVVSDHDWREALGLDIFTPEKLDEILLILSKCGPHNEI